LPFLPILLDNAAALCYIGRMMKQTKTKREQRIEALREVVRKHADEYQGRFGIGPCGALAMLLKEYGWGPICYAETSDTPAQPHSWFGHYLNRASNGLLIDISGCYIFGPGRQADYRDIEEVDGPDDDLWTKKDLDFWRERLGNLLEAVR